MIFHLKFSIVSNIFIIKFSVSTRNRHPLPVEFRAILFNEINLWQATDFYAPSPNSLVFFFRVNKYSICKNAAFKWAQWKRKTVAIELIFRIALERVTLCQNCIEIKCVIYGIRENETKWNQTNSRLGYFRTWTEKPMFWWA